MFPGNCVAIESGIEWIKQRKCVAKTKITKFRFEQRARARERERKRERKIEREMVGDGPLTIWKHTKSSPSFPCISSGLTENIWHDKRQNSPTWIIQRKKFFHFLQIVQGFPVVYFCIAESYLSGSRFFFVRIVRASISPARITLAQLGTPTRVAPRVSAEDLSVNGTSNQVPWRGRQTTVSWNDFENQPGGPFLP